MESSQIRGCSGYDPALLEDQIQHNKYLALHDELTGLPNRRLFLDRLALSLERARRMESKAALLVIDLNHFKQVNDSLGHHAGDVLLKKVSSIFSSRVRRSDTVARTGGDEFSLILEEPTNRSNAKLVARSLMKMLEEHFKQVNDSLGHHAGDLLLKKVSEIFSSRVRRSDTVARTGGDEFSLILEEPTNRSNAKLVAKSLMEMLLEPMQVGDHTVQVGASIGVAVFPDDAADIESLALRRIFVCTTRRMNPVRR